MLLLYEEARVALSLPTVARWVHVIRTSWGVSVYCSVQCGMLRDAGAAGAARGPSCCLAALSLRQRSAPHQHSTAKLQMPSAWAGGHVISRRKTGDRESKQVGKSERISSLPTTR